MVTSSGVKYLGLKGHSNCRITLCPCLSAMMSSISDCGRWKTVGGQIKSAVSCGRLELFEAVVMIL